jgi:hypothetical protein
MTKTIHGMKATANHFGISAGRIRWMIDSAQINPAKVKVGELMVYFFGEKELKIIELILKNQKTK